MYYPYFRGKQFELIAIRESVGVIAEARFVPIIEPVRESLGGLERALDAIVAGGAQAIVVVNPRHGDHRHSGESISALLARKYSGDSAVRAGILLTAEMSAAGAVDQLNELHGASFIHAGFSEARALAALLEARITKVAHVFLEDQANILYRRHFAQGMRILIGDGFERMKNADYRQIDMFSDLHVTYGERGMNGYGDFLTVGDSYSEGGGPAYAVAIHLTFIDPGQDYAMFVYHFKSDTNDTPLDPALKFSQALGKLISRLDEGNSHLEETSAIREFRDLHQRRHFPGLGYVKKLSIKHHLETLSIYHSLEANV